MCEHRNPERHSTDNEPPKPKRKLITFVQHAMRITFEKSQLNCFAPGQYLHKLSGEELALYSDKSGGSLVNNVSTH